MKPLLSVCLLYGGVVYAAPPTEEPSPPTDTEPVDESPAAKPIGNEPITSEPLDVPPTPRPKSTNGAIVEQTNEQPTTADAEVFFAFDSSELDSSAKSSLLAIAERAKDTPGTQVILDAHADPRGTAPYNVGLTARRAESVRAFLKENGFDPNRVVMAMYGEDGPRRETFALDRRVSLTITGEPLYSIIDTSKNATAVVWEEPVTLAEIEGPDDSKVPQTARR
jgi:outer membrane protein OmpA-like peptidoglycan-associated protein